MLTPKDFLPRLCENVGRSGIMRAIDDRPFVPTLKTRRPIDRRKSVGNRRVVDVDLGRVNGRDGERGVLLLISTAKCNRMLLMWFGYELDWTFAIRRAISQHKFDLFFLRRGNNGN